MATADELLEECFGTKLTVNLETRVIDIPKTVTNIGVESDDDVKRLCFIMPRYYHGIDLYTDFDYKINYVNANGDGDVYEITEKHLTKTTEDNDTVIFDWLVGRNAVAYKGEVVFNLCLRDISDGDVVREFNTTIARLQVLEGLETGGMILPEYIDLLEQWKQQLFNSGNEGILAALQEAKESGEFDGAPGPKGDKGDKGDTGETGAQGPKGDQGETGPQGIQGIQGPKGDTGDQGPKGDTGETGPQGEKGDTGEQGPKGDTGEKGDKGESGVIPVTGSGKALISVNGEFVAQDGYGYEEKTFEDIEWDGNTEGLTPVEMSPYTFYKISDIVLTEELVNPRIFVDMGTSSRYATWEDFVASADGFYVSAAGLAIVTRDNLEVDLVPDDPEYPVYTIPEKGLYSMYVSGGYYAHKVIASGELHTLDNKYLESGVVNPDYNENDSTKAGYIKNRPFYEEKVFEDIEWDGNTEGLVFAYRYDEVNNPCGYYKVSDIVPIRDMLIGGEFQYYYDGSYQTVLIQSNEIQEVENDLIFISEIIVVVKYDNTVFGHYTFPSKGIYFANADGVRISKLTFAITLHTINNKFLESGVVNPDYNENDSTKAGYIKNRPFYEESNFGELTYYGPPASDADIITVSGMEYVWIADTIIPKSTIVGCSITIDYETEEIESYTNISNDAYKFYMDMLVSVVRPTEIDGVEVTKSGLYYSTTSQNMSFTLTAPAGVVHTLDPKFLPMDDIKEAVSSAFLGKNQGSENAGKVLGIGTDGVVTPVTGSGHVEELVDTTEVTASWSPVTAAGVYSKYNYIYIEIQMNFTNVGDTHLYTTTIPVATIRTGMSYMPCRENNNAGKDCAGRIMFNADGSISAMKIAIGGYDGCSRLRLFGIN